MNDQTMTADEAQFLQDLEKAQKELEQAKENELRAMADYKNLVRRTQEERVRMVQLAARDVVERMLEPIEYLRLAKEQLKDKGLDMVYERFLHALEAEGVKAVECMGKPFDQNTMEVVDKQKSDKKDVVIKVMRNGYTLNGEVIQHAKVIIGE